LDCFAGEVYNDVRAVERIRPVSDGASVPTHLPPAVMVPGRCAADDGDVVALVDQPGPHGGTGFVRCRVSRHATPRHTAGAANTMANEAKTMKVTAVNTNAASTKKNAVEPRARLGERVTSCAFDPAEAPSGPRSSSDT